MILYKEFSKIKMNISFALLFTVVIFCLLNLIDGTWRIQMNPCTQEECNARCRQIDQLYQSNYSIYT